MLSGTKPILPLGGRPGYERPDSADSRPAGRVPAELRRTAREDSVKARSRPTRASPILSWAPGPLKPKAIVATGAPSRGAP
jgi:hypothetical protein